MEKKITESPEVGIKGVHILRVCDMRAQYAQTLEREIQEVEKRRALILKGANDPGALQMLWKHYRQLIDEMNRLFLVREATVHNITTTVGRKVLAERLAGITTNTGVVNYAALGTSPTTPSISDIKLGSESYRKAFTGGTVLDNVSYLETYYASTEVSGNFEEFGFFIDGSASADSGKLWNRFTESISKTTLESLNQQSIITFSNV